MALNVRKQRGSFSAEGVVVALLFLVAVVGLVLLSSADFGVANIPRHHRTKHHVKLVKTKDHKIYVQNDDGAWFEYVRKIANGMPDSDPPSLPSSGSSSFRLPPGSWQRVPEGPKQEEVEEQEETVIEEGDGGEPEADANGDIGEGSDGNAAAGDSGTDSGTGGDSGGDSGGGDGGGGDGGSE